MGKGGRQRGEQQSHPEGTHSYLWSHFQDLTTTCDVQSSACSRHAVIYSEGHCLPVLCCAVAKVRTDAKVIVLDACAGDVLQPVQAGREADCACTRVFGA